MYKIIFSDIDGTLRNSKKEITQRTIDDIKKLQKQGIEVVLCSGRPRCVVEDLSRACNASRYIISSNGAEVYDYISKKVIYRNLMKPDKIEELYKIAQENDCVFVMISGDIRIVNKYKYNDETEIIPSEGIVNAAYQKDILQCDIIDKDLEKMRNVKDLLSNVSGVKIINRSKCFDNKKEKPNDSIYCDVVDDQTSKGTGAEALAEYLGVGREETIAIGDSYNDIDLLDFAGLSVAMGNSVKGLKSKTDITTDKNDLDGAAVFFEKLLDGKIKK